MAGHVAAVLERHHAAQSPLPHAQHGALGKPRTNDDLGVCLQREFAHTHKPVHRNERRPTSRHQLDSASQSGSRQPTSAIGLSAMERQRYDTSRQHRACMLCTASAASASRQRLPHHTLRQSTSRSHRHTGCQPAQSGLRRQHRRACLRRSGFLSGRRQLRQLARRRQAKHLGNTRA